MIVFHTKMVNINSAQKGKYYTNYSLATWASDLYFYNLMLTTQSKPKTKTLTELYTEKIINCSTAWPTCIPKYHQILQSWTTEQTKIHKASLQQTDQTPLRLRSLYPPLTDGRLYNNSRHHITTSTTSGSHFTKQNQNKTLDKLHTSNSSNNPKNHDINCLTIPPSQPQNKLKTTQHHSHELKTKNNTTQASLQRIKRRVPLRDGPTSSHSKNSLKSSNHRTETSKRIKE